jgi:hypothetical protein
LGAVIRRFVVACASAAIVLGSLGVHVAAAASVTFDSPSASSTFGKTLVFTQPIGVGASAVTRTELLLLFPDALGPNLIEVPQKTALDAGQHLLTFSWDPATDGHIVPNTVLTATWQVTTADGAVAQGPPLRYRYRDDRFDWQTQAGPLVRIHWYRGDAAFGARALQIAEDGVHNAEQLLGVTETDPIDFYVYADQTAFYDALGPGTPENVGGEAHADIRTMFGLIAPSEVDQAWVKEVVPHELTHLVFNTAVKNPYHFPPRWLNEGLAVYLSRGYVASDRDLVAGAGADGTLAPLPSLGGSFPNGGRFFLAYAESVSAVDYLVRTYGKPALVTLIRSYSKGLTDDEAFTAALGVNVSAFDAGWRAALGAKPMASSGPRPAPAGPLPPDWTGTGSGSIPGGGPPAASFGPDVSRPPLSVITKDNVPVDIGSLGLALAIAVVAIVVVVVLVALAARRTGRPG